MNASDSPPRHRLAALPWVAAQAVLVLAAVVWWLARLPLGIPGVWAWMARPKPFVPETLVRAVAIGAAVLGLCWLGGRRIRARRRSDAPLVAGLVVLALCLQLALLSFAPHASFLLVASEASPVATDYFGAAGQVSDPLAFCREFAATMPQAGHHVATHPPGAVLFYWVCLRVYRSPVFPGEGFSRLAEFAIGAPRALVAQAASSFPGVRLEPQAVGPALFCCLVLGLCAALSVVPLYHVARAVSGRRTALVACCLFAVSPAPALFFQGLDAVLLLLVLTALAWTVRALVSRRLLPAAGAGLALGFALFISFGVGAAVVSALGVVLLWALRAPAEERAGAWRVGAALAAALAVVVLASDLLCGLELPTVFRQAMASHRQQTWIDFHRTYGTWVWLNLVEFGCFLGLPVCVAIVGVACTAWRRGWRGLGRGDLVGLVGLGVVLLLDLSGSVRGEVGRVWLFLMPPLVLWAACWLAREAPGKRLLAAWTLALTLLQLLVFGLALTPVVMPV